MANGALNSLNIDDDDDDDDVWHYLSYETQKIILKKMLVTKHFYVSTDFQCMDKKTLSKTKYINISQNVPFFPFSFWREISIQLVISCRSLSP